MELVLKEKTKQSPFIAILILAQEQGEVTAENLRQNLLPTLPLRACNNLLARLEQQGYLTKNYYNAYQLTNLGEQSATDKSFWIGEKGVYNIYVSDSNLINEKIIKIEKVEKGEDDRNGNVLINTPNFISQYQNQILNISKKEIRIEEVENKCFKLNNENCVLEIEAKENDSLLKILKDKQTLFQSLFETNELELKEELLTNSNEFQYDEHKKVILVKFDSSNLPFNRKLKIKNPYFQDNHFNSVEIENVAFIPSDEENAKLWLDEILFKSIDEYFLDENSFNNFASEKAKPILAHYRIEIPTRSKFKQIIEIKENSFYQIAKLQTIDYLNY